MFRPRALAVELPLSGHHTVGWVGNLGALAVAEQVVICVQLLVSPRALGPFPIIDTVLGPASHRKLIENKYCK